MSKLVHPTLWASVRPLQEQLIRTPEAQRDPLLIARSFAELTAAFAILDRELSRRPFFAGDDFSFGDIPLGAAAQRWFNLPVARPAAKAVEALY